MRILTYSSLFPNDVDPTHGIFVERRLSELRKATGMEASVVAPVPWFPSKSKLFGAYGELASVADRDRRQGVDILHPRYPVLPKVGMRVAPFLMSRATIGCVRKLIEQSGPFDVIDAHYFYPDGVAAAWIANRVGLPYMITARGSDINLIGRYSAPRKAIVGASRGAGAVVAVSNALAKKMCSLGVDPKRIHVIRNGVDLDFFCPGAVERREYPNGDKAPLFLSVGLLKEAKGHDIAIRFVASLAGSRLVIVGEGPHKRYLKRLARDLGVSDRVTFAGRIDSAALRTYYRNSDALILMTRREGMPNVVLESLACGTPVLATAAGGIPEILTAPEAGRLVADRTPKALADAWAQLSSQNPEPERTRKQAEKFSWQISVTQLARTLEDCVRKKIANRQPNGAARAA